MVCTGRSKAHSRGARRGSVLLGRAGQALPRFCFAVGQHQHWPSAPQSREGHSGTGGPTGLCLAQHGHRAARAARQETGRNHPRRFEEDLLHPRRRRGQRKRHQDGALLYGAFQDSGALSFVPRCYPWGAGADWRLSPPAGRAGHAGRGPSPRPVLLSLSLRLDAPDLSSGVYHPRRRGDPARRSRPDRRHHPRRRDRHERTHHPARRILAPHERDLR